MTRAASKFNNLELVTDYTECLEVSFFKEVDACYPQAVHNTEQLYMCIKGLGGVVEIFTGNGGARRGWCLLYSCG